MGLNHQKSMKMKQDAPLSNRAHPFCSRLILVLLSLASCTNKLPTEAEQEVYDWIEGVKEYEILEIKVEGKGKILPWQKNIGINQIFCIKVVYNTRQEQKLRSIILQRKGEMWEIQDYSFDYGTYEDDWKKQSCPGTHEERQTPLD